MTDLRNCICKVGNGSYDRFLRCEGQRDEMPAWDNNFLLKSHLDMATLRMTSVIELQSWYCSSTELSQSVCLLYEVYLRTNFYISLARVPRDFSSEMYCRLECRQENTHNYTTIYSNIIYSKGERLGNYSFLVKSTVNIHNMYMEIRKSIYL